MPRYTSFVIFAEMRTGSNHLEELVNQIEGVTCHGELFNPSFMGHQGQTEVLGLGIENRDRDPVAVLHALKERTDGLHGFRYFHDHDPRVLSSILEDDTCAKITLSRSLLDSYVSLRIARATNQWKITDAKDRRSAKVHFDPEGFTKYVHDRRSFRSKVLFELKCMGQSSFQISYDEIGEPRVIQGLARWLGASPPSRLKSKLKRQNPGSVLDKVTNPDAIREAVLGLDDFGLSDPTDAQPVPQPALPALFAASRSPLMFLPLPGGPNDWIEMALAALDETSTQQLQRYFTEKTVRQWKNRNKAGRCFAVVTHPALRMHRIFCDVLLTTGNADFANLRKLLRTRYDVGLPEGEPGPNWGMAEHRNAFLGFLRFARANLAGQTSVRAEDTWASQFAHLQSYSQVIIPDRVIREHHLVEEFDDLLDSLGLQPQEGELPNASEMHATTPFALGDVYDDTIETAVRDLHNRDFMAFGFRPWSKSQ